MIPIVPKLNIYSRKALATIENSCKALNRRFVMQALESATLLQYLVASSPAGNTDSPFSQG